MWQQHCYPSQFYQHSSPRDEQWVLMDFQPNTHEQKSTVFQPQLDIDSQRLLMPYSVQGPQPSYEYDPANRTVSPTMSHYSSSLSEASASSEQLMTPNGLNQSTPFAPISTSFPGRHVFGLTHHATQQHMVWQPQPHTPWPTSQAHSNFPLFVPSHSPLPMSNIEMIQYNEASSLDMSFHSHADDIQPKSPNAAPQPQELEYCEDNDLSEASTTSQDLAIITPTSQSTQAQTEDEDTEEEPDEQPVLMDQDSDSDYNINQSRRRGSRTTPKQKHSRKCSSGTVVGQSSRVHKRTSSSGTTVSVISASTSRSQHGRCSPKTLKKRGKGPNFPAKMVTPVPKSERVYPCTFHRFGCTSEFPSKNEWKRHVACQHLQLGYYRCDMDGCNPDTYPSQSSAVRHGRRTSSHSSSRPRSQPQDDDDAVKDIVKYYNDFNRKDLFTQHCRRMHGPTRDPALCSRPPKKNGELCPTKEDELAFEAQLTEIRARCWHVRRPAPSRSSCGFCQELFDAEYDNSSSASTTGSNGRESEGNEEKKWEERMEHVGRHYEKEGAGREEEKVDDDLVEWGLKTGVLRRLSDGRPWLVNADDPTTTGLNSDCTMDIDTSTRRRGTVTIKTSTSGDESKPRKKARRQPSRTAVVQRRVSFKEEELDSDDAETTVYVGIIKSEP